LLSFIVTAPALSAPCINSLFHQNEFGRDGLLALCGKIAGVSRRRKFAQSSCSCYQKRENSPDSNIVSFSCTTFHRIGGDEEDAGFLVGFVHDFGRNVSELVVL
ncbi:unnamed protein product, partial [Phaeothamnion confervicola]